MRYLGLLIVLSFAGMVRGEEKVDPAALVREVRASEGWIDHVRSFRAHVEGKWVATPQAIEHARADLKKRFPQTEPTTKQFAQLQPQRKDKLEFGWDPTRAYCRHDEVNGPGTFVVRIFDGKQAYSDEQYSPGQELYALEKSAPRFMGYMLSSLPWPRTAPHTFWFSDDNLDEDYLGKAETFELRGPQKFRGVECYVLETPLYWQRLYVGVADHRLYGSSHRVTPRSLPQKTAIDIMLAAAKARGKTLKSIEEYSPWLKSLSADEQQSVNLEYFRKLEPYSVPQFVNFFSDYKEVAPNCWMPMSMGYDCYDNEGDKPFVSGTRELKVSEVAIDRPLPDDRFVMTFQEGIEVNDWGHDPPLFYKYKKDRTPAEWQVILEDANRRQRENNAEESARNKLIGQAAPAFPKGAKWLKSEALDWEKLRGKVVILDFWAEWCGPCRNDLPRAAELHKEKESGIVIIGVHNPGSEVAAIEKVMKEFDMQYPICIDVAEPNGPATWGTMSSAYGVNAIPHAFLIDREGKVASQGSLGSVLAEARQLVAQPAK